LELMTEKLKLVTDAPSILTVLDAVTQAQAVLAGYTDPAPTPRDADAALRKLAAILDGRKVAKALDALLPDET
jgi:hypothetical protein